MLLFSHCHVWLFATEWTAAHQASLSFTVSWKLLRLMSSDLVMPSNHLILCSSLLLLPLMFTNLPMSQLFPSGGQSIGASASASVLPMNIQGWFPLGLTSLVAQMVKRLSTIRETWVPSLGQEDPLEKEMAILSSTIAWKIPWTEEPSRLQSMGLQRVGHDWVTSLLLSFTGLTGLISLQSKGLSRVFSNTTVQKHQFYGSELSSQSNSHIHTWPQEKP